MVTIFSVVRRAVLAELPPQAPVCAAPAPAPPESPGAAIRWAHISRPISQLYYRQLAYLLTTELRHSAPQLLQTYFDRWQIEVNRCDEKHTPCVGQAQLWNVDAVPKQPALVVAAYSALLLASPQAFGIEPGPAYPALRRWRRHARRPSCLDLVTLLRKEMVDHPESPPSFAFPLTDRALTQAADA